MSDSAFFHGQIDPDQIEKYKNHISLLKKEKPKAFNALGKIAKRILDRNPELGSLEEAFRRIPDEIWETTLSRTTETRGLMEREAPDFSHYIKSSSKENLVKIANYLDKIGKFELADELTKLVANKF